MQRTNHHRYNRHSGLKENTFIGFVGFENYWQESNCFLNTTLQALISMSSFTSYIRSCSHSCKSERCFTCEVRRIVDKCLEKPAPKTMNISKLREMLARRYEYLGEFALHEQADSLEALGKLLNEIHEETPEDCPAHKALGLSVQEQYTCKCSLSYVQDWDDCTFVHHVNVKSIFLPLSETDRSELLETEYLDDAIGLSTLTKVAGKLPECIKQDYQDPVFRTCINDDCAFKESKKSLTLLQVPKVFVIHLVWEKKIARPLNLAQVCFSIPFNLSLDQIYEGSPKTIHNLRGMIVFSKNHYIYCLNKNKTWYILNDKTCSIYGNGCYHCLINFFLMHQCVPVAAIYEESSTPEIFTHCKNKLIQTERKIIVSEKQDYEFWNCVMNSSNPNFTAFQFYVKNNFGNDYWGCKNYHISHISYNQCQGCSEFKSPLDRNSVKTPSADETPGKTIKRHYWLCEECNNSESSENRKCSNCNRERENSFRCFNCNGSYPDSLHKCQDCGYVLRCSECNSSLKPNKALCHQCGQKTKSKHCKRCKIQSNPICKSCYSWECLFCKNSNKNPEQCENCSAINYYKNIANRKTSDLKCHRCKTDISLEDSKICYICLDTTANWVCSSCQVILFPHNYGCQTCHFEKWTCEVCKRKNSSLQVLCRH